MSLVSIIKKIKAYYNKDGYVVSINYKGHPLSATGSTEESVIKSVLQLMSFVDFMEDKKLKQTEELVEAV